MKHQFVKIALAVAMIATSGIEAKAQFGSLLSAAKKKAAETVDKEVKKQKDPAKNLPKADKKEGDVTFFYVSGNRLGIWHSQTRTFERFVKDDNDEMTTQKYIFKDNGTVEFDNGNQAGELLADGTMNSGRTQGIKFNADNSEVTHNGEWVGKVADDGSVYMFNDKMIYAEKAIDKDIACYVLFNTVASDELLNKYKQKYKEIQKQNEEQHQRHIAALKAAQNNANAGNTTKLWWGGSVFGELRANDEVWINGSRQGGFENGRIRVGGSFEGELLSNGDVRKGGSIVGKIDNNGKVWLGGSIVGEVRQNGDIVKGGSIVGKAQPMNDARKIAVIYFFHFWNF